MLLDSLKKTYAADPNVPQHFYRALDELIEIAQQLAHERLPANPQGEDRASPLGNLEAMRDGVSHAALVRETIAL